MPPPERRLALAAALALGLVLVVVVASAAIRLGPAFDSPSVLSSPAAVAALRVLHRTAASLEVVVVLWLGWMAWRARDAHPLIFRAVLLAIGLTAFLSVIGIAAGQNPPAAGAAANLLGGLVLASAFAWLLGALPRRSGVTSLPLALAIAVLLAIQLALGARLSIFDRTGMALPLHGLLAMALAALLGWIGLVRVGGRTGKALFAAALAAPLAGFTSLHYEHSAGAAMVHAAAAALLLAATAYALARGA